MLATSAWSTDWTWPRRVLPAVSLAGVCAVAAIAPVGVDDGPVVCPFRVLTGHWCPGCGGTRAVRAVVRADVAGAMALNPWAVLVLVQLTAAAALFAAVPTAAARLWRERMNLVLGLNAAVAVVAWSVRLGTGAIP